MDERVPPVGGKIFLNPSLALRPSLALKPTFRRVHYNAHFLPPPAPNDKIHINPHFLARTEARAAHIHFNPDFLEAEKCPRPPAPHPTVLLNPKFLDMAKRSQVTLSPLKVKTKHKLVRRHPLVQPPKHPHSTPTHTLSRLSKYKIVRTTPKVVAEVKPKKNPLRALSKYSLRRVTTPSTKPYNLRLLPKAPFSSPSQVGSVLRSHIAARRCSRLNNTLLLRKVLSPRESLPSTSNAQRPVSKVNTDKSVYKVRRPRKQVVKNYAPRKTKFIAKCKLKKDNQQCQIFNRFGRCKGKERNLCTKVHNPKYVSLCKRFLKGECNESRCTLSHLLIPEKMPTCHHYLAGRCIRENCLFLHVKHSRTAPICRQFLDGFCPKGVECCKRHEYLCPLLAEKGTCPKGVKCIYPHPGQAVQGKRTREAPTLPKDEEVPVVKESPPPPKRPPPPPSSSRYFSQGALLKEGESVAHPPPSLPRQGVEEEATALALLKMRPTSPLPPFLPLPNYPDTE